MAASARNTDRPVSDCRDRQPSGRQRGGIATIAGGVVLAPVAAFTRDPAGSTAVGTAAILLLVLDASLLPRVEGPSPVWLRALWLMTPCVTAPPLGDAGGAGDRMGSPMQRACSAGRPFGCSVA